MSESTATFVDEPEVAASGGGRAAIRLGCMERCEEMRSGILDLPEQLSTWDWALLGASAVVGVILLIIGGWV